MNYSSTKENTSYLVHFGMCPSINFVKHRINREIARNVFELGTNPMSRPRRNPQHKKIRSTTEHERDAKSDPANAEHAQYHGQIWPIRSQVRTAECRLESQTKANRPNNSLKNTPYIIISSFRRAARTRKKTPSGRATVTKA